MQLVMQSYGDELGTPLLIAHGLFGAGRNWRALARNFAKHRWVVCVDMRNHGQSPWADSNTYFDLAGDLSDCIENLGGRADVLGHSMGGKAAMVLALSAPQRVNRLMVADIAPLTYAHSQTDNIKLMQNVPLDRLSRRSEAQALLQDLIGETALSAFFAQNILFEETGPRWQLNLSALAVNMGDIIGFPTMQGAYDGPTLMVRGGDSEYVDDEGLSLFGQYFPDHRVATLPNTGHWLHAEDPHGFIAIVEAFLNETETG